MRRSREICSEMGIDRIESSCSHAPPPVRAFRCYRVGSGEGVVCSVAYKAPQANGIPLDRRCLGRGSSLMLEVLLPRSNRTWSPIFPQSGRSSRPLCLPWWAFPSPANHVSVWSQRKPRLTGSHRENDNDACKSQFLGGAFDSRHSNSEIRGLRHTSLSAR